MQKRTWKNYVQPFRGFRRIALAALGVFMLGVVVLAIHIYVVTRPRVDADTRVMVRIDLGQDIGQADADRITAWLYRQKGVDHVLVNPASDIAIFTFAPLSNDANRIVGDLQVQIGYKEGRRYLPSEKEMQGGCPVATTSASYKVARFIQKLF
ncbi:MAG: hypothetical protein JST42_25295 [Bacteroidetes bacterium]|nr:hypothetical protein [Bacteroidota bacterium]